MTKICEREDCFAFDRWEPHSCQALDVIDFDEKPCPFYQLKCNKDDCFAFSLSRQFNCRVLNDINFHGKPCSFYKRNPDKDNCTESEARSSEQHKSEEQAIKGVKFNVNGTVSKRQNLSRKQKKTLIRDLLKKSPDLSDRQVAKKVSVDHKTVRAHRAQLEEEGVISARTKRCAADGRMYPAKRGGDNGEKV